MTNGYSTPQKVALRSLLISIMSCLLAYCLVWGTTWAIAYVFVEPHEFDDVKTHQVMVMLLLVPLVIVAGIVEGYLLYHTKLNDKYAFWITLLTSLITFFISLITFSPVERMAMKLLKLSENWQFAVMLVLWILVHVITILVLALLIRRTRMLRASINKK